MFPDIVIRVGGGLFGPLGQTVDPVGRAAQRDLPQRAEMIHGEKMAERLLSLFRLVDFPLVQPRDEILRLDVHQLDLVGAVEHPVGNAFPHRDARHRRHDIV